MYQYYNSDFSFTNNLNALNGFKYGLGDVVLKDRQKANNDYLKNLLNSLTNNPKEHDLKSIYNSLLISVIFQNTTLLKDSYNKYKTNNYKDYNPTLSDYDINKIENDLKGIYSNRLEYSNDTIKQKVNKEYTQQLGGLKGLNNREVNKKELKKSVKSIQNSVDDLIDDNAHKLRADLSKEVAKQYKAIGYIWKNQQDRRVVGNPFGLYPKVKDNQAHGNHWKREGVVFLYDNVSKAQLKEIKRYNILYRYDRDLEDGSPGEPYGCRCYRINFYNVDFLLG